MAIRGVQEVVSKVGAMFEIGDEKDAVDLLKADHRKVEELFFQFERTRSVANKQQILDQIIKELTVHTKVEESLVYPLLEDSRKTADRTAEAYEEHHIIKTMLTELAGIPASNDTVKAKLKVLREIVRHHVKEEEMSMLPQLRRSGTDLERLSMDIRRRKQVLLNSIARSGAATGSKTRKEIAAPTAVRPAKPAKKTSAASKKMGKRTGASRTINTTASKTANKKMITRKTAPTKTRSGKKAA